VSESDWESATEDLCLLIADLLAFRINLLELIAYEETRLALSIKIIRISHDCLLTYYWHDQVFLTMLVPPPPLLLFITLKQQYIHTTHTKYT